ncbi:MAG: hypothetical protein PHR94_06515 [Methylomonas lenta]|jgi:hypothetical protein|nr:hypothetical protein [Methylomonas lenta]
MVKNLRNTYQINVTLDGIKPPIWRGFLVPSSLNLYEFNIALQVVMGWLPTGFDPEFFGINEVNQISHKQTLTL